MLTHLEYEQVKRALERLRNDDQNGYSSPKTMVKREDVLEILIPYVEGFEAPFPFPDQIDRPA